MKKILCWFDYFAKTGYGTVSKNIVSELKKYFGNNIQLDIVAVNYFGEDTTDQYGNLVTSILNDDKKDEFGRYLFLKKLKETDYDGVFIINDLGIVTPILEIVDYIKKEKNEAKIKSFKTIFYFPVDCLMVPELCKNLEFADVIVTYTDYAKKIVSLHRPELLTKIKTIPHGNNFKEFYPIEDIKEFRNEYFGRNANKYIFSNINRNQPRKDLPSTIFAFIEAKNYWNHDIPPFLYLHCHPKDPMGWDLRILLRQTNLVEDVDFKLLPKEYEEQMTDIETLNKIYNASDCYVTTTLGEGWGLGFSEAASCKIPIIAPYSTSFKEMSGYGKNAYMLKNMVPFCNMDNLIREQVDIYELSDTMIHVAKSKNKPEQLEKIEKSYNWAKNLEWSNVCKNWIEHFKQTFQCEKRKS
jgi:glycosyltransferase involved in cell wall biosynthesis